jgi:hypothetical protein
VVGKTGREMNPLGFCNGDNGWTKQAAAAAAVCREKAREGERG